MTRDDLVRWALGSADKLAERGQVMHATLLRRLARELVTPTVDEDRCRCGGELAYVGHGRRRRWCSERCRRRYRP